MYDPQSQLSPPIVNLRKRFDQTTDFATPTQSLEDEVTKFHHEEELPPEISRDLVLQIYHQNKYIIQKLESLESQSQSRYEGLEDSMKIMKEEIAALTSSQKFISDKFDKQEKEIKSLTTKVKNISTENTQKDKKIDQLTERLRKASDRLKENESNINSLEQYGRKEMINIFGIPRKVNEDTDDIVLRIAERLDMELYLEDIEISHRTSTKEKAPIIVKFNSRRMRNEMWDARWDLKHFTTKDIGFQEENSIFINESLTEHNREIFKDAWNKLKKPGYFERVTTIDGITYAWKTYKRDNKSEKIIILSKSDIIKQIPLPRD
ncbi:putative leucine-rich repeat-containing protein DDB_G0290503 [Clytia hemisphaerica]|uniref:putative leucine-rich repeat-containing protein DDB_G0290503 n=1 Tax=Clytia hemisphaerica TaxID=252671 RepID=UPI0034D53D61